MSDAQPKSCACKSAVFRLFQKNGAGREFEIDSPEFDTDDFGVPMGNLTATDVWKLCLEWMSVVPATNDDTPRKGAFQLFLRNGTSTGLTPMPIHGSDLALRSMLRKNLRLIIYVSAPKLAALVKNKAFKALNSLSPIAQLAHELAKRSSGDSSLFSSDPSAASSASGSSAGGAGDRGGRVGRGGGGGGGPSATAATPGIDDGHKRRGRGSSGANTTAKAARTDGGKDETDNGGDGEGGGDDMKSESDSSASGGSDGEDDDDDSEAEFPEELNAEKGGDGDRGDLYDQEDLSPENMRLLEDEGDVFMEVDSRGDGLSASVRELLLDNYQLTPAMVRVCFNVPFAPDHHRRIATLYRLAESARFDSVFQNELEGGGDAVATMSHECFAQHGLWEKMLKARKVLGRLPEETPELSVPNARFNWCGLCQKFMPMSTLGTTKALRAHMILRHHPNLGEVLGGVCSLEDMQDPAEALKSHQYDADQCRANYEVAPSVAVACAAGSAHKKQLPSEAAYVPKLAALQDATSAGGGDDDDDVGD